MTAHIETKEALRTWIRNLWIEINQRKTSTGKALELIDALHAEELKGECRGEILDILDKAAARVGGDRPQVVEREDGEARIPASLVQSPLHGCTIETLQARERPSNIIQLPMGI